MKRVEPASIGVTDLGTVMQQQADELSAPHAEEDHVFVWTLQERNPEFPDAAAEYMGVHTTSAGAWLALKAKAIETADGLRPADWLDGADVRQITAELDDAAWIGTYSVSRMPVVTP